MRTRVIPVLMFLFGVATLTVATVPELGRADSTIEITAVPSKFTPDSITLHVGETTKLDFTKVDGVHGIESSDLGIPNTVLTPGKDTAIDVTPKKAGTYVMHCEIICGTDHKNMTLTVTVEA